MNVLVIGGTRFFGVHLVQALLEKGHEVTIATRGNMEDPFGSLVRRIRVDRTNMEQMRGAFADKSYDAVCDDVAYCSNDVRCALETIRCTRYVLVSTISVYDFHEDMKEEEVNPYGQEIVWCNREDFTYDEVKRQAEKALFTAYCGQEATAVRFPFVIGMDDYTKRLLFYVKCTLEQTPMYIDNPDSRLTFIDSGEAGRFLAHMAEESLTGPVNAASGGTISVRELLRYVEQRSGISPILSAQGVAAPYNEAPSFSVDTGRAQSTGFSFTELGDWIYTLLDGMIEQIQSAEK